MTTGRIDYSPDYKSEKKLPTIKEMSGCINFGGRVVFEGEEQIVLSGNELKARLEREVIERAKEWPANYEREELLGNQLHLALFDAAQSLIEFESVQEKKG